MNIGSHIITGVSSSSLSSSEKNLLSEIKPSGVILFARNFSKSIFWKDDLQSLIESIKESSHNSVKLISIDFEGGRVNRFPNEIQRYPYAQEYKQEVSEVAAEMADILCHLGFNLTYSPCVDLDIESRNTVIGKRSFGADPDEVSSLAFKFIEAHEARDIRTCLKHFPGHGRTISDSHFKLPVVSASLNELQEDLVPYITLLKDRERMVMLSHVIYTDIDSSYPATLSKKIVSNLLREELSFNGVTCTDDMDMKALEQWSLTQRAELSLSAGIDFLLYGNGMDGDPLETSHTVVKHIEGLLDSGYYDLELLLEQSQRRISKYLKRRY